MKIFKCSTLGVLVLCTLVFNCEYISLDKEFFIEKIIDDGINKTVKIEQKDAILLVKEINAANIHKKKIGMWTRDCNFKYIVLAIDKRRDTTYIVLSGNKFKIENKKGNRYFVSTTNIESLLSKYFAAIEK